MAAAFLTVSLTTGAFAQSDPSAPTKRQPTAGQLAAQERQKKCAAEWTEAKAAGKVPQGTTWPKFWSACNARLKAQAQ